MDEMEEDTKILFHQIIERHKAELEYLKKQPPDPNYMNRIPSKAPLMNFAKAEPNLSDEIKKIMNNKNMENPFTHIDIGCRKKKEELYLLIGGSGRPSLLESLQEFLDQSEEEDRKIMKKLAIATWSLRDTNDVKLLGQDTLLVVEGQILQAGTWLEYLGKLRTTLDFENIEVKKPRATYYAWGIPNKNYKHKFVIDGYKHGNSTIVVNTIDPLDNTSRSNVEAMMVSYKGIPRLFYHVTRDIVGGSSIGSNQLLIEYGDQHNISDSDVMMQNNKISVKHVNYEIKNPRQKFVCQLGGKNSFPEASDDDVSVEEFPELDKPKKNNNTNVKKNNTTTKNNENKRKQDQPANNNNNNNKKNNKNKNNKNINKNTIPIEIEIEEEEQEKSIVKKTKMTEKGNNNNNINNNDNKDKKNIKVTNKKGEEVNVIISHSKISNSNIMTTKSDTKKSGK
jgi:hypothetical protein